MKQRYRNNTLLSPISRIKDHLHKSRHSWIEVSDEVQHGGAGGGDELLTHRLQPPVHLRDQVGYKVMNQWSWIGRHRPPSWSPSAALGPQDWSRGGTPARRCSMRKRASPPCININCNSNDSVCQSENLLLSMVRAAVLILPKSREVSLT